MGYIRGRLGSCGPTNQDGTTWGQAFAYDPFGNITKTVPLSMTGISWQPGYNTQNQYTLGGTSYDGNGNLTADTFNTYAWDSDGNTIGVNLNGSSPVNITYDALDRAVEENNSGTYKQILYGPTGGKLALMARQSASSVFVPLPGGEEATYTGSTIRFRHYDWLGSARFESNMTQREYGDAAYAPFGEPYSIKDTPYLSFTGAQQDTVSGTYDFLYREYNPVQGRWISPDPAGLNAVDAANPQSWNRYAYVVNNPLSNIDPLGLDCVYVDDNGDIREIKAGECYSAMDDGFYFDGTVNGAYVDDNGDVQAQVNGSNEYTCSGECPGFTFQSTGTAPTGEIGPLSTLECAAAFAPSLARTAGIQGDTFMGKVGQTFLSNTFSGIYDTYRSFTSPKGTLDFFGSLVVNGLRQGVGGKGLLMGGVAGAAQDKALQLAFQNLGRERSGGATVRTVAGVVGNVKVVYSSSR